MFSRKNPSPDYVELLQHYKNMHEEGYKRNINGQDIYVSSEDSFPGNELPKYATPIKQIIEATNSKSILDYGAGKGKQYEMPIKVGEITYKSIQDYWAVNEIIKYEPALPEHNNLPDKPVDGVISTDVLEHIPLNDISWVVDEMFSLATKFVFVNIACYPALARLPDGRNAHCTIKPPQWWSGFFHFLGHKYPNHKYLLGMIAPTTDPMGNVSNQLIWVSNMALSQKGEM